jgi:hypothetical protein
MGYKIYTKSKIRRVDGKKRRFGQWDGKTFRTKTEAINAMKRDKREYREMFPDEGSKVLWEVRSDGKTRKMRTSRKRKAPARRKATKPARRGGFTGEGFGDPLGTMKFRGFM